MLIPFLKPVNKSSSGSGLFPVSNSCVCCADCWGAGFFGTNFISLTITLRHADASILFGSFCGFLQSIAPWVVSLFFGLTLVPIPKLCFLINIFFVSISVFNCWFKVFSTVVNCFPDWILASNCPSFTTEPSKTIIIVPSLLLVKSLTEVTKSFNVFKLLWTTKFTKVLLVLLST